MADVLRSILGSTSLGSTSLGSTSLADRADRQSSPHGLVQLTYLELIHANPAGGQGQIGCVSLLRRSLPVIVRLRGKLTGDPVVVRVVPALIIRESTRAYEALESKLAKPSRKSSSAR
jgi:hypothetical protein